jgi:hypothetical protein
VCVWARSSRKRREREEKKRRETATSSTFLIYYPPSRVARRWLQEAKRDAFFSSLNRTQLLLRLSVCLLLSLVFFFETQTAPKPYRSLLCWSIVYITGSSFLCSCALFRIHTRI